jgi:hypothetical protein
MSAADCSKRLEHFMGFQEHQEHTDVLVEGGTIIGCQLPAGVSESQG